jgi:transcriptional regulator with XRE-family HTH domain
MTATPMWCRRQLATKLRELRTEAGMSGGELERAAGLSNGTISRIEGQQIKADPRLVESLLDIFKIEDPDLRVQLLELAKGASGYDWPQRYGRRVAPPALRMAIGLEAEAEKISIFSQALIPGLLQTPEYASAVIRARHPAMPEEDVAKRVEFRVERQQVFSREDPEPPQLHVILSEGVLLCRVGSPRIMQDQAKHLFKMSNRPGARATIQILPFVSGAHASMVGSFSYLKFRDAHDPSVIYEESLTGTITKEKREHVDVYQDVLNLLIAQALPIDASRKMIKDYSVL